MNNNGDPLADQLRREALAERPAFSSNLHDRILDRINDERLAIKPRGIILMRWLATAAAVLVVSGVAVLMMHPRYETAPLPQVVASNKVSKTLTVDFQGLLFAQLTPTGLTVRSPLGGGSISSTTEPPKAEPTQPAVVPASPEWLLAQLQAPTSSAKLALADVIPPQVLELAGWSKSQQ